MQTRRIVVASPHGFCAGVRRAIESVETALARAPAPLYCLNEIVHNRTVVEGLAARGVVFVREITDVSPGASLVLSAHGVSPAVRAAAEARGLRVLDATCPFVSRLHAAVRGYVAKGFAVLLIGHRGHDEIVGIQGEAPGRIWVIESRREAEAVEVDDPDRVAVVTQTTLSVDETAGVMEILRARFPRLATAPRGDICRATVNRQEAVKRLAREASLILVLGSENSSNTRRLVEVARAAGAEAHLVDSPEALARVPVEAADTVGLTAGASTPEPSLESAVAALKARGFTRVEILAGEEEDVHFALPPELRAS